MEGFNSMSSLARPIHVYLSFRGDEETCKFTDRLWAALESNDLNTIWDDKKLEAGDSSITPHFLKAIKKSCISIVVFSKDYASSIWCLEELSAIAARIHERRYIVFPIFYDVDPSEVQEQSNSYEKAFAEHQQGFTASSRKVHSWREAMKQVANLPGWDVPNNPEPPIIDDMVIKVKRKMRELVYADVDLVGMRARVREVEELLDLGSNDAVRFVGICGMGGIGKTTLARVLYDKISHHFDASYFLLDTYDFNYFLHHEDDFDDWMRFLHHKRTLIVFDDPDVLLVLRLAWEADCNSIGGGSRIIITTRDEGLLKRFKMHDIYRVKLLTKDEALQLFCRKAFKCDFPMRGCEEQINSVLEYANGLPLAIEILGSFLYNRRTSEWSSALVEFKKLPNPEIMKVLRKSFDFLDRKSKEMFLDIACFFVGKEIKSTEGILESCHPEAKVKIQHFIEKSLMTIIDQKIIIHGLVQEMGRDIVRHEFPSRPEEWSRLWDFDDIYRVMQDEKVNHKVQAIVLELEGSQKSTLRVEALSNMSSLRLLIFRNVKFYGILKHLPSRLQYMSWHQYPFTSLPYSFLAGYLIELILPDSYITKLWEGEEVPDSFTTNIWGGKSSPCLRNMNLSGSKNLIEMPNFRKIRYLKRLDLEGCSKLSQLDPSIAGLPKSSPCLRNMNLSGSKNLIKMPNFRKFPVLERLDLEGCTKLSQLDPSIAGLPKLKFLNLRNCCNLVSIPNDLFFLNSLEILNLACCTKLAYYLKFPTFEELHDSETFLQSFPCKRQKLCRQKYV